MRRGRPPEAFRLDRGATAEAGELNWTKEEIRESIVGFFEQFDAHEEKMRQRMEKARQKAIREVEIKAKEEAEFDRQAQEEAERQRLRESDSRYEERLAAIRLRITFEHILETRPEQVAGKIVTAAITQLQPSQEE